MRRSARRRMPLPLSQIRVGGPDRDPGEFSAETLGMPGWHSRVLSRESTTCDTITRLKGGLDAAHDALTIYDEVPGGTGYLKQFAKSPNVSLSRSAGAKRLRSAREQDEEKDAIGASCAQPRAG